MKFDIERMVADLGGSSTIAKNINANRCVPYGWMRRACISSLYLSQIKEVWPELDLNQYFIGDEKNDSTRRSPRISGQRLGTSAHQPAE